MSPDRKTPPEFKTIDKIDIQHAVLNTLDNGIKVYTSNLFLRQACITNRNRWLHRLQIIY